MIAETATASKDPVTVAQNTEPGTQQVASAQQPAGHVIMDANAKPDAQVSAAPQQASAVSQAGKPEAPEHAAESNTATSGLAQQTAAAIQDGDPVASEPAAEANAVSAHVEPACQSSSRPSRC